MAYCSKCGKELKDEWNFCEGCGTPIKKDNAILEENKIVIEENVENEIEEASNVSNENSNPKNEDKTSEDFEEIKKEKSKSEKSKKDDNVDFESKESNTKTKNKSKTTSNKKTSEDVTKETLEKVKSYWNKLSLFYKFIVISIIIVSILLISALNSDKLLPLFITIVQIVGIIFAILINEKKIKVKKDWIKYLLVGLVLLVTIFNIKSYSLKKNNLVYTTSNSIPTYINSKKTSNTPYSSEECLEKKYEVIKEDFKLLGFKNITEEIIYDLEKDASDNVGNVEYVSINGVKDFQANEEFNSDSMVVIKYHTYKKVAVPIDSNTLSSIETEKVLETLENAGFINLKVEEKSDLDPDTTDVEFKNVVSIGGTTNFEKDAEFEMDSDVVVTVHRQYEKYTVKIDIEFYSNLIFDTYGVNFTFNGETKKLNHGEDKTFEFRVEPGKYTGTFESVDSSSIDGGFEIDVIGDTNAAYWIDCYTDYVQVNEKYVENKGAIKENEAMVPDSAYGCKYEDYKDIEDKFKNSGFTNISTEILYDIYWGVTPEGEVEKVSINGNTDFKRGAIFPKDANVVITYHMKETSDPNYYSATNIVNTISNSSTTNNSTNVVTTETNSGTRINLPRSSSDVKRKYYKDIEEEFKKAGFTDVALEKIEDITPTSTWNKHGEVKEVTVNGKTSFKTTEAFDSNVKVVIKYHDYPVYEYTPVTVSTMTKELEKNAANAKEKYEDKYFEISGKVATIDADLSYITIYSGSNTWNTVMCMINNEATERMVKTLSKGQSIKVRCQITSVGEVLGYTGYITEIIK